MRLLLGGLAVLLSTVFFVPGAATQGMMPQPRGGMGAPDPKSETKEGPAEAAPEEEAAEEELPPLPAWPTAVKKRIEFFELDGYFRLRADLRHNLNLSQNDIRVGTAAATYAPYWGPLAERSETNRCAVRRTRTVVGTGDDRGISASDCPQRTLSGANLRLRLEPRLNVSESVRVRTQLDVLDNLSLGSTPDNLTSTSYLPSAPTAFFSDSQAAPVAGENSATAAIVVKRVWGEVDTPLGQLSFGRMPWHWGLGVLHNDGQCWDCNVGNNLDRVAFVSAPIAGHRLGLAYDFAASGPSSATVLAGRPAYGGRWRDGSVIDLEQLDDVDQLALMITRVADETEQADRLARGELVTSYGAYILWRQQSFDYVNAAADGSGTGTLNRTQDQLGAQLVERHAWSWTADGWARLAWRKLRLEAEALIIGGRIENVSDDTSSISPRRLLQYGLVARSRYLFFGDKLKLDFELGSASGDDSELFDLNRRRQRVIDPNLRDASLNELRFNPDFLVDLILFREILGTVANATYLKPSLQFDFLGALGTRLDLIYSFANNPTAYPGNARSLGLEMDLDLYYQNLDDGFTAGLQYGLLIPLGALDRPASIYLSDAKDAGLAQTLRARMVIKF